MSGDPVEDDNQSRKRHLHGSNESTPTKRTKSSYFSIFSAPLSTIADMFGFSQKKPVVEVSDEEDDDGVVIVSQSRRAVEKSGEIVFLNENNDRLEAGKNDEDVVVVEKSEEKQDDDVILDKTVVNIEVTKTVIHATVEEKPSTPKQPVIQTSEVAPDDDLDVQYVKLVKTPNRNLQMARKMQNELIFLNDGDSPDEDAASVRSGFSENFQSPTPDESASRSQTPMGFNLPSAMNRNPRDFWKRSDKKPSHLKRPSVRSDGTISRIASSVIQKTSRHNEKKKSKLSLETYMNQMMEAGFISQYNLPKLPVRNESRNADLIERAQKTIAHISSRSNSPASLSRQSSITLDRSVAGSLTPSTSSDFRNNSSSHLLSKLDDLTITHYDKGRYRNVYDSGKIQEFAKEEELKIRKGYRSQTKDDVRQGVTKTLYTKGVFIRPKEEEKEKDEFEALPESAEALLRKAWARGNSAEVFVNAFNIQITRQDLQTLNGLNWLNDNIINYYLQLICERSTSEKGYPRVYAFNTFFYTNVVDKGYASVKRWTRKVDIFSFSILLVPVHLGVHWTIAIIDIEGKKIEFYDSLYNNNPVVLSALEGYMKAESLDKKKVPLDTSEWTIRQRKKIPKQQNGSDCGVFSCQFAEWASRRKAPEFSQDNMSYYRRRMVHEIVTKSLMSSI